MVLKALTTIPTAFLVGMGGQLGYRAFERLAHGRGITPTRAMEIIAYAVVVLAPFLMCVVGVDRKRWEGDYWFSQDGKTDRRRTWMRWAAYFAGAIVGYALLTA